MNLEGVEDTFPQNGHEDQQGVIPLAAEGSGCLQAVGRVHPDVQKNKVKALPAIQKRLAAGEPADPAAGAALPVQIAHDLGGQRIQHIGFVVTDREMKHFHHHRNRVAETRNLVKPSRFKGWISVMKIWTQYPLAAHLGQECG